MVSGEQPFFFSIGRYVLRRRRKFVELTLRYWKEWCGSEEMRKADDRSRSVHGLAYGAFRAASEILQSHTKEALEGFRTWLVTHALRSVAEVKEAVNVNQVWQHIIDAFKAGAFGYGRELARYFKVLAEEKPHPPGWPNQEPSLVANFPRWYSYKLYFDYNGVLELLQGHLRKTMGKELPLQRKDLRAQLEPHAYFLKGKKPGQGLRQRMGDNKSGVPVWGIDLDLHPMGFQPCADEDAIAAFNAATPSSWDDPRKGELYLIVHALEKRDERDE